MFQKLWSKYRHLVEKSAFGVCQGIGEGMNIKPSRIRLYFIYLSFITFGSPVFLYLIAAFWLNIKNYFTRHKEPLLD